MTSLSTLITALQNVDLSDLTSEITLDLEPTPTPPRRSFRPSVPPLLKEERTRHWDLAPLW